MLEANTVSYRYVAHKHALKNVSLQITRGAVAVVLGANGSGKTTLLVCLCGIRQPTSGEVRVDNCNITHLSAKDRARYLGYVPQVHEPVFAFTVQQVVLMGRSRYWGFTGRPSQNDYNTVIQSLKAIGLWKLRNRRYTTLSGGERRLTLIARGLAQGASYLLMDEPDAHLDPRYQHQILSTAVTLAQDGFGVGITSHNPNNALRYGDHVLFLSEGQVITQGHPQDKLTSETLERVYNIPFDIIGNDSNVRAVLPNTQMD